MKRLGLVLVLLLLGAGTARAQYNACNNPYQIQSAVISISTATTTAVITNSDTTKQTLICAWNITIQGVATTANTVTAEYGTGATCGTGTTALTGPMPGGISVGIPIVNMNDYPVVKPIPAGNNTCLVTTQAGIVAGSVVYVIQ